MVARCVAAEARSAPAAETCVPTSGVRVASGGAHLDVAGVVARLHHRTFADEQAGQRDGLFERTPTVAAQIENDALHVFGVQLGQQSGNVGGRAASSGSLASRVA